MMYEILRAFACGLVSSLVIYAVAELVIWAIPRTGGKP